MLLVYGTPHTARHGARGEGTRTPGRARRMAPVALGLAALAWAQGAEAQPAPPPPATATAPTAPPPTATAPQPPPPPQPYAPPAYPPPPYYPPPAAPPTAYAPAPAPAAPPAVVVAQPCPAKPTVIPNWDPDRPTPEGYVTDWSFNTSLITSGATLLATGWLLASLGGIIGAKVEEDRPIDEDNGVDPEDWAILYVPIAGPFAAMQTVRARPSGIGLLLSDGLLQVAGTAALIAGFIDQEHMLVRYASGGTTVEVRPLVTVGASGVSVEGAF
ncbi:MAG: hypothetical protein HY908_23215 [Myxococcales bacterium]|nr:hypothetical protein [Myxococcales bacterium]